MKKMFLLLLCFFCLTFVSSGMASWYYSAPAGGTEDLSTYTCVEDGAGSCDSADSVSEITTTSTRVTWDQLTAGETSYLYYDKTAGYFDTSFTVDFDVNLTGGTGAQTIEAGDSTSVWFAMLFGVGDTFGSNQTLIDGDCIVVLARQDGSTDNEYRINVQGYDGGVIGVNMYSNAIPVANEGIDSTKYFRLTRSGTTVTITLYNESGRSTTDWTMNDEGSGTDTYRYMHAMGSIDNVAGGDAADYSSGYVENVVITP